jgi:hypothetical protein
MHEFRLVNGYLKVWCDVFTGKCKTSEKNVVFPLVTSSINKYD